MAAIYVVMYFVRNTFACLSKEQQRRTRVLYLIM